jgi:hypothetical protein
VMAKFAFGTSRLDVAVSLQIVSLTIRTTNCMDLFHYTIPSQLCWDQPCRYTYVAVVKMCAGSAPEDCLVTSRVHATGSSTKRTPV